MKNKDKSSSNFHTSPDIELLCDRFDFLMQNRERILADPLLAGCRLEDVLVGFSFAGAIPLSLGLLLAEYAQGHLAHPCKCGGTAFLLSGGAGLSGASLVTGWCPTCRRKGWIELAGTGITFRQFVNGIITGRSRFPLNGALSLRQVCDFLEGRPVEILAHAPSGQPVLRFEPRTGNLLDIARSEWVGTCLLSLLDLPDHSEDRDSTEPPYGAADGRLHVAWNHDWTDTRIPGIPKGDFILRTRNHPGADRVLLGLGSGILSARDRGPILRLDGRIPLRLLGLWAWKASYVCLDSL